MSAKRLYAILGVAEDATLSAIVAAYRKWAPKCHPNSTEYDPATFPVGLLTQDQYWLAISEAIEVLSDPQLRCRYNTKTLKTCYPIYVFSGKCFELFQRYFMSGHSFVVEPPVASNGNLWIQRSLIPVCPVPVQHMVLRVTLEELFNETEKTLPYLRMRYIGGKSITKRETLAVPINRCMRHDMCIVFKGFGHETELFVGDVVVRLHLHPHPIFAVVGDDLASTITVPLSTAMFGGVVQVQTIDAKIVKVFVNPIDPSAGPQTIRFEGEGMPTLTGRGDLLIYIKVTVPPVPAHLSGAARRIVREIEEYRGERAE